LLGLEETRISCPYCGENISILIHDQELGEQYIEDCQVCCRPIVFVVNTDEAGKLYVSAYDENETF